LETVLLTEMDRRVDAVVEGVNVTLAELSVALIPFVVAVSFTVPANWSTLRRVIVELAFCPLIRVKENWLAVIPKSGPVTFT
jgi:hypothetical protein